MESGERLEFQRNPQDQQRMKRRRFGTKGWGATFGFPKLQVIFRTRGLHNRPLVVKLTWKIRNPMVAPHPLVKEAYDTSQRGL